MILMSIDASTKATGVAIFDEGKLIHYECLYENDANVLNRISNMTDRLISLAIEYKINEVALEDVMPNDVKHNQQIYTVLMYLQGSIALALNKIHLKINKLFVASNWRKIVGIKTGRGVYRETLKKSSMKLVKDHYNIDVNDDVADAVCIGIAYLKETEDNYQWE